MRTRRDSLSSMPGGRAHARRAFPLVAGGQGRTGDELLAEAMLTMAVIFAVMALAIAMVVGISGAGQAGPSVAPPPAEGGAR